MKLFFSFFAATLITFSLTAFAKDASAQKTKVRIGWQVPWAIQGQIVQVWKHTDILAKNHIEAEFIGKTAGPELNELALGDNVDVILTADQPAAALFMKTDKWQGISRLMYNRTATYVPIASKISSLEDLKGKKVGVPFGTAAQRVITEALTEKKIEGVNFVNFGMLEQPPLILKAAATDTTWGDFDALSGFDPIPAILESNKKVKMVHKGKVCALVVANKDVLQKNKKLAANLIKAVKDAYVYYKKNTEQVNTWFIEESHLTTANAEAFLLSAEYEPNFKGTEIRTSLSKEDFALIQKAADFVAKATKKEIKVEDFVTNKYQ